MKKTIFMMLFLALGIQQALAQDFNFNGINYTVTSPTTASVGQNPDMTGAISIPAQVTYNGSNYSVTSISDFAFDNCSYLMSVTIPSSVYIIGYAAFANCFGLTSVTIPNSVMYIEQVAFYDCYNLTNVICNIANPLSIDGSVFYGINQGFCSLTVPAGSEAAYASAPVWQNFMITMNTAPQINVQPVTTTICKLLGADARISVYASSASATPVYKWYSQLATSSTAPWVLLHDNANYVGTDTPTLTIVRSTAAIPATGTKYKVEVSANGSAVMSDVVSIQDQTVLSKATAITAKSSTNAALLPALTACEGSRLNLTLATGSIGDIEWMYSSDGGSSWSYFAHYSQPTLSVANGVLTATSPPLASGTAWFRVVAFNGVCHYALSTILKIAVSTPAAAGSIREGDVTVCAPLASGFDGTGTAFTSASPIRNDTFLNLDGSIGTITWQKSVNYVNTTGATPIWTKITNIGNPPAAGIAAYYSGAGTTTSPASPYLIVGNLAVTTWYRAVVTNGACTDISTPVKITVTPSAKAGAISCPATVCEGGDISFYSAAYTGDAIQWQYATASATGPFYDLLGATGPYYTYTGGLPLNKFYIRSKVTSGSCTAAFSAVKTITVNPTSVAGTVTGGGTVCNSGVAGTLKLAGYTGTIQWQYSTDGGATYTNAPSSTGTMPYIPFTTTSTGIAATYIVSNVTTDTYFRALVTSGACYSAVSNAVAYHVASTATTGPVIANNYSVCSGSGTALTLYGSVGAITWQKSVSPFTTWTAVTTSVTPTLNTGNLTATTKYRASVSIGTCSTVTSNEVILTVPLAPLAKAITANVTTPAGTATAPICLSSPVAKVLTIGTGSIGAIQWQVSTISATSGFSDITDAIGNSYTISAPLVGANFYRATFTNVCGVSVTSAAITVYYKDCPAAKAPEKEAVADFGVIASPSPFTENFNLNLTTSSEDKVQVMVYDMVGQLIDQQEVSPSEANTLQVGAHYASGVYNVIVTQGENSKTLRVVKR